MKDVDIISKVVGRKGEAMTSPSKDAASVNLSAYLLKEIWDKCWEIRTTDKGEEYLFGKLPVGLQFDLSSFVDGGLINLPTLYDGLRIDGQTLKWKEVTNEDGSVTRVLESVGSGGTAEKVTWANIEDKPTWIGDTKPTYSWNEIEGKPDLSKYLTSSDLTSYATKTWVGQQGFLDSSDLNGYATETWVGNNYLPLTGSLPSSMDGEFKLQGDLRLRDGTEYYGRQLFFGDGDYCYIGELSDDKMTIYGDKGVVIKTNTSSSTKYYIELTAEGIKLNGGLLKYNGSYWEIEGDVLVTGGITSYE
jgi:hypothetical protein